MLKRVDRKKVRRRIRYRVRKKISGTPVRPRLAVYRSLTNIYAQVIDDESGKTLAQASSLERAVKSEVGRGGNVAAAKQVGAVLAGRVKEKGIDTVVFDRGGFIYHGRVKALADAAREAGLKF